MLGHTWEDPEINQIWAVNQANQNDWPRETWKKYPIKVNSNCHEGVTQRLSLSLSPPVCLSTRTELVLFLLVNTLLASLLMVFVAILFRKVRGPGPLSLTTGALPPRPSPVSGWERKPRSKPLRAETTGDQTHTSTENQPTASPFWLPTHSSTAVLA